ncbi:uncharacterized protein MYCFIDRAFT_77692 [Pseudocercospora fijiensis CIRAD86]|uniref:RapZ C-terminal domain-containing protein n=1 Tax=Pseudocercospora fijiensis (strain CIRAD86) TaxID=383855 RepID=M2YW92_PSEFD|nr:uncharacterized protein MYCFIDRAFT_77692 [Pseudocercospora fijiensis CIRAD86]EME81995.1 hypothetical protein MYCFIDRAFT_77692 [Pseudocercospora fijiensis CIRAD86]
MSSRNRLIVSHARNPPLNPPGDLRYDLRSIPNPPKHIRDAYNGTSKRLREWMLAEPAFVALVEKAARDIEESMKSIADESPATKEPDAEGEEPGLGLESLDSDDDAQDEMDSDDDDEDDEAEITNVPDLTVDVSCEKGRHRSVAFAEELATRSGKGWNLQVIHRDINSKRKHDRKHKQKRRDAVLDEDD